MEGGRCVRASVGACMRNVGWRGVWCNVVWCMQGPKGGGGGGVEL